MCETGARGLMAEVAEGLEAGSEVARAAVEVTDKCNGTIT